MQFHFYANSKCSRMCLCNLQSNTRNLAKGTLTVLKSNRVFTCDFVVGPRENVQQLN